MDTSKIIKGVVNSGRYTVTAPIVKEDYGLYLQIEGVELPSTYEVDFSNSEHSGTSVTMIGNSDGVLIPHQFIDTGKDIFAFLYHVGDNYGKTVYKFRIPNKVRPDRTNEEPTPEEQSVIDQAISALNEAVAQTAQDVIDADASAQSAHGYAEQAETARDTAQTYANNAQASATSASQSAQASANSATASANSASQSAQIKADVESLADDAQGYADSASQSASQASASEQGCARAVLDAASAAAIARARADEASGYAQTASAMAQNASQSASTASQKAAEASQSASQASGYAQTAESAKTDAQTAQGKAEDAQTAAETAQGKAEDAQEAAESAAASVQASAAQIAENTADIVDLQTDVAQNEADILKAFPTDTASGSIASFTDGADDLPLKSLVVNIDPVQDTSSGDPSPENICPISGWTGCNVEACGKNLWNDSIAPTDIEAYSINGNKETYKGRNLYLPKGTYTFSYNGATVAYIYGNVVNADGSWVSSFRLTKPESLTPTFTLSDGQYAKLYIASGATTELTSGNIQLELGTTATAYEPYNGTTIPISWQTEAGTVYGGKLDVLSGVMRVDRAMVTLSKLACAKSISNYQTFIAQPSEAMATGTSIALVQSSTWKGLPQGQISASGDGYVWGSSIDGTIRIKSTAHANMTADEFKATFADAQFVYKLANPIEIQLTPTEVRSLLGVNNIFADTGDCSVEYRADTKLYIERLTEPDADMIADSNIVSGQYFMVGNSLYLATANIASGAQVIVGTNATRKSLSEALNEING